MLNNKLLLIVSVIAVAAVIAVSVYFGREKRNLSPVINVVPTKAAFILETDDFSYLTNKISKNEDIISLFSTLNLTKEFNSNFLYLDSLIRINKTFKKFLNQKNVIISAHLLGQNDIGFLFATSFSEKKKTINEINTEISKLDSQLAVKKISFAGAEIYNQKHKTKHFEIFYTFYEDYFLLTYSEILLQKAIKNINSGASYFSDNNFKTLYQNKRNNSDATLYLNYENFFTYLNNSFNNTFKDKTLLLRKFADWSAFDINIKRKEIKLTGHTNVKAEMQYLTIFKNIKPQKSRALKFLPDKTSSFLSVNIGSGAKFKYKYEDYLGEIRHLNDHQINLASFIKKYKLTDDENTLYEITANEIGVFLEDVNKNGKEHSPFVFLRHTDRTNAETFFNTIINIYCENNKLNTSTYKSSYRSNNEDYTIFKTPEKNLPEMFYGVFFQNINAEYVTFINDFIIFGETKPAIQRIIDSFEKDRTFKRKSQNYSFIKSLPDQSNIFFYTDLFHSKNSILQVLNKKSAKQFKSDIENLESVQGPAIQFISDSYPIYTTLKIALNSKKQQISETIWEVRLDTIITAKPFIILNHNTQEKEIIIQDAANKIYLINKTGKILWTRQLDGKIISEIFQIDYYENNKLQLLFNTKSKIYCIDRIGNWLEGYPVELKSRATSGISVFDYDYDKNYRIFVATKNKKVSLYSKEGKVIDGWVFNKTKSEVNGKIYHYKNKDKDYITFRDKTQIYILNRKGETRINPEANIQLSKNSNVYFSRDNKHSKAHFSITNPSGTVYSIFENGKIRKETIKTYSNEHFYSYKDINGDNISDFIFTDKNQTNVYNGIDKKRIYSYSYDENIINDITVYKFTDNDIRIGTSSKNKIYLINNAGRLCKGFPLTGSGLFSITNFGNNEEFSLIVGNRDKYLYKYQIK